MTSWQVAVGGRDAGGTTVGAGLALPAGVAVGAAVGAAVGLGVGAALGDAVADADALGLAEALALAVGDGSGADGLTRMRRVVPLMSSRFIWLAPRWSRRPTPCKSLRNAC